MSSSILCSFYCMNNMLAKIMQIESKINKLA